MIFANFLFVDWDGHEEFTSDSWDRYIAATYVINMKKFPERLKRMEGMLAQEQISFTRVEGPDGKNLHHLCEDENGKSNQTIDDHFLGCSHAHYLVLMDALKNSFRDSTDPRWILAFEDDALIMPNFKSNLMQVLSCFAEVLVECTLTLSSYGAGYPRLSKRWTDDSVLVRQ
jgi:GR25 family glycosyltransferase involved in LPS biosynthesis